MVQPNVVTVTEAAREKDCTRQALYNAIDRGDLDTVPMGRYQVIVRNEKYEAYAVRETGGRLHQSYREKQEDDR